MPPSLSAGLAAKDREKAKRARYGADVLPLSFESHGRLGASSLGTVQLLASWACAASPGQRQRESVLLRRWQTSLEAVLVYEKADLLVQSLGGTGAAWMVARD